MLVWGGWLAEGSQNPPLNTGGRYDPVSDSWSPIQITGAPAPRVSHTAVWSGSEMIVWGGSDGENYRKDGGLILSGHELVERREPVRRSRRRGSHSAVWTGTRMIAWGGDIGFGDPADDGRIVRSGVEPMDRDLHDRLTASCESFVEQRQRNGLDRYSGGRLGGRPV